MICAICNKKCKSSVGYIHRWPVKFKFGAGESTMTSQSLSQPYELARSNEWLCDCYEVVRLRCATKFERRAVAFTSGTSPLAQAKRRWPHTALLLYELARVDEGLWYFLWDCEIAMCNKRWVSTNISLWSAFWVRQLDSSKSWEGLPVQERLYITRCYKVI